jgi:hypothetical protein
MISIMALARRIAEAIDAAG